MDEEALLARITVDPTIYGGKPIIRGRHLAVEHVLAMLAAGDDVDTILAGYAWLEREDVLACLEYARRMVAHERTWPLRLVTPMAENDDSRPDEIAGGLDAASLHELVNSPSYRKCLLELLEMLSTRERDLLRQHAEFDDDSTH